MIDGRIAWEARARQAGNSLRGVLFSGLSDRANALLHDWHARIVVERFSPYVRRGGTVLYVGCGYGRLSTVLGNARNDLKLIGQDISSAYLRTYAQSGFQAVQADLEHFPFSAGSLDGAMAVTSVMYVERSRVVDALLRVRKALRPEAPLLLIDPGEELRIFLRFLRFGRGVSTTGGAGFTAREYLRLADSLGMKVIAKGGNPRSTLLFLASLGGHVAFPLLSKYLTRDGVTGGYSRLALHRWMLLRSS